MLPRALGPAGDEALAGRGAKRVLGSTRVAEATGPSDESQKRATGLEVNAAAVAHSTRPLTRSGWRRPSSSATGPPIE